MTLYPNYLALMVMTKKTNNNYYDVDPYGIANEAQETAKHLGVKISLQVTPNFFLEFDPRYDNDVYQKSEQIRVQLELYRNSLKDI